MDDPWGSPWADDIQIPASIKTKEDVTRRAPLARVSAWEEKLNSPWGNDDDDRFRGCTALPKNTIQTSGVDTAADNWHRHNADSREQTIALPDDWGMRLTAGTRESSNLMPSLLASSAEFIRHPPADPWALDGRADKGELEDIRDPPNYLGNKGHKFLLTHELDQNPSMEKLPTPNDESMDSERLKERPILEQGGPETDNRVKDRGMSVTTTPAKAIIESQNSYPVSRQSSSPSEQSHHDEPSQESPRTSFEKEQKPSRFQSQRKVSAVVQGLVEHFDGLAQKEVTESAIRSSSSQELNQEDDDNDFGDFEEGLSDTKPDIQDKGFMQDKTQNQAIDNHQHSRSLEDNLEQSPGPVEFLFDIARLENIFSSDISESTCETVFILDSIPFDSFSSTEERKTWYRVSRYGTLRQHNSGNDENYVRVAWKHSKIRDETLKVVSRWIEEDRTSGRVVLGRCGRGSSAFEWNDTKAPAVPLAQAFSKHRKPQSDSAVAASVDVPREWPKVSVRDRSTSKTLSPTNMSRQRSPLTAVQVSGEFDSSTLKPLANNELDTGSRSAQGAHGSAASGEKLSGPVVSAVPFSDPPKPPRAVVSPHSTSTVPIFAPGCIAPHEEPIAPRFVNDDQKAPKTTNLPSLAVSNIFDDDDDDWGDMVSSPATPTLPVLLPQRSLRHKKSQSFGGIRSDTSQISKGSAWTMESLQPGLSSRTTTGFDDVLTPTSAILQMTSDVNLSMASPLEIFSMPTDSLKAGPNPPAASYDPWATADFSFFDATPAPVQKPIQIPTPNAVPKIYKFGTPAPVPPLDKQRPREESEQDLILQAVVKGLPDLSYMLRK
ncbi:hypothetical protein JHW43_007779 [Diplocarpon mali]|nr:hypothetical protein JHW43_007779 [Diplocarpon mali]